MTTERYCPECGSKLEVVKVPNENDFFTRGYYLEGTYINRAGKKYDKNTGKKMYRTEYHCPTKRKTGFWCRKERSHYIILGETDLIE